MIIFINDKTFFDTNQIAHGRWCDGIGYDGLILDMSNGEHIRISNDNPKAELIFKRLQWLAAKDEEIAKANIPVK